MKKFFSLPRLKSRTRSVRLESERAATSSPVAFINHPSSNLAKRRSKKRLLSLETTREEDETSIETLNSIQVHDLETERPKIPKYASHDLRVIEESCDESTPISSTISLETKKKKRRRSWAGFNNIKQHLKDLINNFNHDEVDGDNDSVSSVRLHPLYLS